MQWGGVKLVWSQFHLLSTFVSKVLDKPCPRLSRSLPWDEGTSATQKLILWKMLVLGHWNYLGNIWQKNGEQSQLKWKSWGEVYLWLMKNDNLYFVCVNFMFLGLYVLSSVQSQMMLAFFFQVIPQGRKNPWVHHEDAIVLKYVYFKIQISN